MTFACSALIRATLFVRDLERSTAFYGAMGLTEVYYEGLLEDPSASALRRAGRLVFISGSSNRNKRSEALGLFGSVAEERTLTGIRQRPPASAKIWKCGDRGSSSSRPKETGRARSTP